MSESTGYYSDSAETLQMQSEDTQKNKYLTFTLDNEEYGIEISNAIEIIGIQQITEVPYTPTYVKGIINLRGSIIPVLDVRTRFRKPEIEVNDRMCIVVVEFEETIIGLIVDNVSDVVNIPVSGIQPPPSSKAGYYNKYIKNIGKLGDGNVKLLLDLGKLLFDEDINAN